MRPERVTAQDMLFGGFLLLAFVVVVALIFLVAPSQGQPVEGRTTLRRIPVNEDGVVCYSWPNHPELACVKVK